jgi:hypothetical protein
MCTLIGCLPCYFLTQKMLLLQTARGMFLSEERVRNGEPTRHPTRYSVQVVYSTSLSKEPSRFQAKNRAMSPFVVVTSAIKRS